MAANAGDKVYTVVSGVTVRLYFFFGQLGQRQTPPCMETAIRAKCATPKK